MTNQNREPKGTRVGGQFAADVNAESTVLLVDEPHSAPSNPEISNDAPRLRSYVDPASDLTMTQRYLAVADIQADVDKLRRNMADVDDLDEWEDGSEYLETLASVQAELIDHQQAIIERLRAAESSFDLETAVTERVISAVETDAQADMTHDEADRVEALVRAHFKDDPSDIFENGLGQLLDKEADIFMRQRKTELAEIVGEDD